MSASLLSPPLLRGEGLPDFPAIKPEQVRQQIPLLLQELNAGLSDLEDGLNMTLGSGEPLGWSQVMDPLQRLGERLRWSWGVVSHLNGVCNSPELREAHRSQQGAVVAFGNRVGQSRSIYHALERLQEQHGAGSLPLDPTQERILEAELLDMQLRGWLWRAKPRPPSMRPVRRSPSSPPVSGITCSMPPTAGASP